MQGRMPMGRGPEARDPNSDPGRACPTVGMEATIAATRKQSPTTKGTATPETTQRILEQIRFGGTIHRAETIHPKYIRTCIGAGQIRLLLEHEFGADPIQSTQQQNGQENGKILATMVIDPITLKHANISVKTPSQLVRLEKIQLPIQARPFLVRQNAQSIRSIGQFIGRQELMNRAECTVDGNRMNTFDNQEYSSPLSKKCYSVLAKDCRSDQSDFVVLMKALQQGKNGQKKLKVIFPRATIECQTKSCANGQCNFQSEQ